MNNCIKCPRSLKTSDKHATMFTALNRKKRVNRNTNGKYINSENGMGTAENATKAKTTGNENTKLTNSIITTKNGMITGFATPLFKTA
tara:strand:+ start:4661 stop:4924 length:264 start_codon:yes stop_codon:yes gene_type:complete